ncbi:unnamed protein product [Bursaphelenchus xylophilus]|uniref:(pine wood nematode) hypothetical protein n=1 Tax=Bursaphelenchus xylophilus TaxID=6326 RepID=A0A1I7SEE0_BURXY|nr:unnamed protein product [Bursaphelenchus xylophilus]CAG9104058.1 unnamed protein product [Bursaphelenchus xylophilus]
MDDTSVGTRSRRRVAPKQKFSPTHESTPPSARKLSNGRMKNGPAKKAATSGSATKRNAGKNGKVFPDVQIKEEQKTPSPVPPEDGDPRTSDTISLSTSQSSSNTLREIKPELEEEITFNNSGRVKEIKPEPMEDYEVPSPPLPDSEQDKTVDETAEDEEEEDEEPTCSTSQEPVCEECSGPLDAKPTVLTDSNVTIEDECINLSAILVGKLLPSEVKWMKDDKCLEQNAVISILTQKLDEHEDQNVILTSLTLPVLEARTLTLTAPDFEKEFKFAVDNRKDTLIWIEKPSIDISDNNELILRGVVQASKTPKIVWTKDGRPIKPGRIVETNRKMKDGQYKCEIKLIKVKRDKDEGSYQVEVRADDKVLTGKINLAFQKDEKPWLVRKPRIDEATNKAGVDFIVFTVVFGSIVEPTVKWFRERKNKESKQLSGKGRKKFNVKPTDRPNVYEATLRIRQYRPIDSGSYCCQITTSGGQCEARVLAKIIPKKKKVDLAKRALKEKKMKKKALEAQRNGKIEPEKNAKKRKHQDAVIKEAKKKKIS